MVKIGTVKKQIFLGFVTVIMAALLFTLVGCNKYSSHYKAMAMVRTNTSKSASLKFSNLEGTIVFKLKCESESEKINYSAKLENGGAKVFYDCNGTKTELFSINSGDDINDVGGELQKGTVYIIVETSGTCEEGRFNFEVK